MISRAEDLPGSVNEPWARKAPRQAASESQIAAETTCGGNPLIGRLFASTNPVCLASASPSAKTRTMYRLPFLIPLDETTDNSLS